MDEHSSPADEFSPQDGMPQHEAMFAPPTEADAPLNDDWAIPETSPTPPHQRFVLLLRLTTVAAFALIIATVVFLGSLVGNTMQATSAKQVLDKAVQSLEHGDFQSLSITEQQKDGIVYPTSPSFDTPYTPTYGDLKLRGTTTVLYQAPNRWRTDSTSNFAGYSSSNGSKQVSQHDVQVSDGTTFWQYYPSSGDNSGFGGFVRQVSLSQLAFSQKSRSALTSVFQQQYYTLRTTEACSNSSLQGSDTVNGRDAYVVEYDSPYGGTASTPSAACDQVQQQLRQEQEADMQAEMGAGSMTSTISSTHYTTRTTSTKTSTNNWPKPTYRMWVDKQTFLVLKTEYTGGPEGKPIQSTEVTNLQVNTAIDAKQFTAYDKPANSTPFAHTPMTATQETNFPAKASTAAKAADYPVFIPIYLPTGLVPLKPNQADTMMPQAQQGVSFSFVPRSELGNDIYTLHSKLVISQHRASYADIAQAEMQGNPIDIGGIRGWATQPISVSNGSSMTGSIGQASVSFVRDGSFIQISGSAYSSADLVKVAVGLQAAPNSHAPLPAPQPPTIAQVRQQSKHQVFVPTDLPAGVVAEPPLAPQTGGSNDYVTILYHNHDGSPAFGLVEMNMGTGGMNPFSQILPAWLTQTVKLSNGSAASYIPIFPYDIASTQPTFDGSWFIWQQGDTTFMLIGSGMGKADFGKIANSMSANADLSPVELPISPRPDVQVAPPNFKVLHPASLPNANLQAKERNVLAPNHAGNGVIISYTPNGEMFAFINGLLLVEMPASAASDLPNDPKASKEQIGGHEVSVTRNKNTCEMMTWQQDGVYYALISPSLGDLAGNTSGDNSTTMPAGMTGSYTYAQMRAVVESLK